MSDWKYGIGGKFLFVMMILAIIAVITYAFGQIDKERPFPRNGQECVQKFGGLLTNDTNPDAYKRGDFCCADNQVYDPELHTLLGKGGMSTRTYCIRAN